MDVKGLKKIFTDVTAVTKIAVMKYGSIEKEEVESPVPPCGRGIYHKVAAPYFFIIMHIVQLYKEDWTILRILGCRGRRPPQYRANSSCWLMTRGGTIVDFFF